MIRTIIEVPSFTQRWKEIGLDDEELQALHIMLFKDPEAGSLIEGPAWMRKVRFSPENRGESRCVQVYYAVFGESRVIYLFAVVKEEIMMIGDAAMLLVNAELKQALREAIKHEKGRGKARGKIYLIM